MQLLLLQSSLMRLLRQPRLRHRRLLLLRLTHHFR
jgi:hypothetical protein